MTFHTTTFLHSEHLITSQIIILVCFGKEAKMVQAQAAVSASDAARSWLRDLFLKASASCHQLLTCRKKKPGRAFLVCITKEKIVKLEHAFKSYDFIKRYPKHSEIKL